MPELAKAPAQLPDAVQPVAFTDDHVSVVELPDTMDDEASVRIGAFGAGNITVSATMLGGDVPSESVHVSV